MIYFPNRDKYNLKIIFIKKLFEPHIIYKQNRIADLVNKNNKLNQTDNIKLFNYNGLIFKKDLLVNRWGTTISLDESLHDDMENILSFTKKIAENKFLIDEFISALFVICINKADVFYALPNIVHNIIFDFFKAGDNQNISNNIRQDFLKLSKLFPDRMVLLKTIALQGNILLK